MVINSQLAPCQQSYRITLNLTVDDDFNPRQIDYQKLFDLSEWESINTHIEDLKKGDNPNRDNFKGKVTAPMVVQVLIMIRLITASAHCKRYR
jgi:hypothetical protein